MKKRGLGAKRGLDALMGNIKKERQLVTELSHDDTALKKQTEQSDFSLLDDEQVLTSQDAKGESSKPKKTKKSAKAKDKSTKKADKVELVLNEQVALVQMPVARLQSGKYQPRRQMDESALNELANSIRQHGIMQPIVVRPLGADESRERGVTHEIIAGERRWRAAKLAGLENVPAIERVLSDDVAIALALIENIQREDLNILEQAQALARFHSEFGMSHAMIADVVGKARATVTNLLRLNNLHDTVKDYMAKGLLDMGHARALLALSAKQQPIIAKKIIDGEMTVRDAEKLVKSILNPEPTKATVPDNHEILALNQRLSDALGANVKLKQGKDGKGSVEIFFHDHDELAQLLSQFGVVLS